MKIGLTRILNAVEDFLEPEKPFPRNKTFRSLDSIILWELNLGQNSSARAIREKADELACSAFDCGNPASARSALVVGQPEAFEYFDAELCDLLARAITVNAIPDSPGTVCDLESAKRAEGQLLQFLACFSKQPYISFTTGAEDALEGIPAGGSEWKLRHFRVKTAKLSALLAVARCAMDGGKDRVTSADVCAACEMVFARPEAAPENTAEKEENDFHRRLVQKFSGCESREVPLALIQTTLRTSRRQGARSTASLMDGLQRRGILTIARRSRCGPTNGREGRVVIIPPRPAALALLPPASAHQP